MILSSIATAAVVGWKVFSNATTAYTLYEMAKTIRGRFRKNKVVRQVK